MIKVEKVKKSFDDVKAVNNLSFEISKGEVVGLLGPNGAGKTTTMRMMVGYLFPDRGRIKIDGRNIQKHPEIIRKEIGYMPENNPIYKEMHVYELLRFVLTMHDIPKSAWQEKIDEIVSATGISDVYYRPIGDLSKGYKQRVGLAQALIHNPKILILDEPTEGLDPNQRSEIRSLIKEIGKERTVILSTHVMQEVTAMCDRAIIINGGKLVTAGDPQELAQGQTNKVYLTVKGNDIKDLLTKIEEVEKIDTPKLRKDKGTYRYEIVYNGDDSFFDHISKVIIENKLTVYELQQKTVSLEDVFQQLTRTKN